MSNFRSTACPFINAHVVYKRPRFAVIEACVLNKTDTVLINIMSQMNLLQIKDYFGSESKRLCDYGLPPPYTSTTNALLVTYFVSEIYYTVWNKFQIQYRHVSGKNIWVFKIIVATREKWSLGFPTRSDTNRPVQLQYMKLEISDLIRRGIVLSV